MTNTRLVAYVLIAIGIVALLSRLSSDAGWLWLGLVAVAFLLAYRREHLYAFLVLGSVMLGAAVGILLEGSWHWPGTFLVSLGAGFAAVDLTAPRAHRWPRTVGALLIALGVITGLAEVGFLTSWTFAVLLIAAGATLVARGRRSPGPAAAASEPVGTPPIAGTPQEGSAPSAQAATTASQATGPGTDADLLTALRAWRDATARSEGRSVALIMSDATLEAIARSRPRDRDALAAVHGIGPVKLQRYGDALLELVAGAGGSTP